jgi:hypothetical protein
MRLVYVFEPRDREGHVCRVPRLLALVLCRVHGGWDYVTSLDDLTLVSVGR